MPFALSPYVLLNGLGLIAGLFLLDQALERRAPDVRDRAYVLFVVALGVGWGGARLLDSFVTSQSLIRAGFTFYGGLLAGAAFFCCVAIRSLSGDQIWRSLNAAVLPLFVAHAFGRVGCYLAGCCFGCVIGDGPHRHPTQLYEVALLVSLAAFIPLLERRFRVPPLHSYLMGYGAFRFVLEFWRDDARGGWLMLSTSQWVSLALLCLASVLIALRHSTKSPNP